MSIDRMTRLACTIAGITILLMVFDPSPWAINGYDLITIGLGAWASHLALTAARRAREEMNR